MNTVQIKLKKDGNIHEKCIEMEVMFQPQHHILNGLFLHSIQNFILWTCSCTSRLSTPWAMKSTVETLLLPNLSWGLFFCYSAETFTLHLIQYSIKPPEYLAYDSNKCFGPYMIYALLLLSIQSDSIECRMWECTDSRCAHHNYWGGKCCLSAVFHEPQPFKRGSTQRTHRVIHNAIFGCIFCSPHHWFDQNCTRIWNDGDNVDVACKWDRKINISLP